MKNILEDLNKIHFVGILGSGMSAIAQYLAWSNKKITGSDRSLNKTETENIATHLRTCGCELYPQNGSGVTPDTNAICVSTAIEDDNPDIAAAKKFGIPILHRSDLLAAIVANKKTIAVAGTSGKSTVTAMIFEFLTSCGKSPSLISGAALRCLEEKNILGNAFCGDSDILVVEADESDGTLVKYYPYASVILNISKDHKPEEEVLQMFAQLICQSKAAFINGDDIKLRRLLLHTKTRNRKLAATFAFNYEHAQFKGAMTKSEPLSVAVNVDDVNFTLNVPGDHNAANMLAALCVCCHFGCGMQALSTATKNFKGVDRRFAIYHTSHKNIIVIDDFAHNPEKIRAAVTAAQKLCNNLIAIYQPHGFGPTRFLKNEYVQTFTEILRNDDVLCFLPIYYAGGTAQKDISSEEIINLILSNDVKFSAVAVDNKDSAREFIKNQVVNNDDDKCNISVLIMGARDPSLPIFAKSIAESL